MPPGNFVLLLGKMPARVCDGEPHHGSRSHRVLRDVLLLGQIAEVVGKDVVDLLDCGVGVALIHPVIQQGFDICRGDVTHHLAAEDRVDLMLGSALQPVVGAAFHGGELEHPEPCAHTLLQLCLGFI